MFCDLNVPYTSAGSAGQASADAEQTTKKTFDALQSCEIPFISISHLEQWLTEQSWQSDTKL
jgi:hypothetical protein